ncbi:hypothetical protein IFM89_001405 [Coptis chinensis]|uniref:Uncharacterized protein n=1 Tax=Coptis chinensis TaxID=261450 RepID=A0A835LQT8_9MAGN|nr:hypothetical protein IFM89_001405 [Coptis chinensis]
MIHGLKARKACNRSWGNVTPQSTIQSRSSWCKMQNLFDLGHFEDQTFAKQKTDTIKSNAQGDITIPSNRQDPIARIRVEHVIHEMNMQAAYDILELFFVNLFMLEVPILETQRDCPQELQEAIAVYYISLPRMFRFTLSVKAPSVDAKLRLLKEIAKEYNLDWDASSTEAEFRKKHEDLLDGSIKICNGATDSRSPIERGSQNMSVPSNGHPIIPVNLIEVGMLNPLKRRSKLVLGRSPVKLNYLLVITMSGQELMLKGAVQILVMQWKELELPLLQPIVPHFFAQTVLMSRTMCTKSNYRGSGDFNCYELLPNGKCPPHSPVPHISSDSKWDAALFRRHPWKIQIFKAYISRYGTPRLGRVRVVVTGGRALKSPRELWILEKLL